MLAIDLRRMNHEAETGDFWALLMRLLRERGLSQRDLSRLSGISTQGIQRWKAGRPNAATVRKLAKALQVPSDVLLPPEHAESDTRTMQPAHASLLDYFEAHALDDDEMDFLTRESIAWAWDPGAITWDLVLATYRNAKARRGA